MGKAGAKYIQLAANPAAGNHCSERLEGLAKAFARAGARVIRSECGPHREFTIDSRADHVCVVGGDGTFRHVAIAAARSGTRVPLSLYPAGTVNLIHREVPCELDPDLYANRVVRGKWPRNHYVAELGDSMFLACASAGPDSAAVAAVSPHLKRRLGRMAYVAAFLKVLIAWPRPRIRLRCDDQRIDCEAFYVAKGRYFAGPWSFAPEARLDHPSLHLVALERATRLSYARFIWALWRGHPTDRLNGTRSLICSDIEAEADRQVPIQADGDSAGFLPARIRLRAEPIVFH